MDADIGKLTLPELYMLRSSLQIRITALERAVKEEAMKIAWNWVKNMKPGETLWVHTNNSFERLRRGDRVTVHLVQPRKKILWVRLKDKSLLGYGREGIRRLDFRPDPPDRRRV